MLKGQKLKDADGYEVVLFPLTVLHMTQDEGEGYSHTGTYNIDCVGTTKQAPLYAPVTLKCVNNTFDKTANVMAFESIAPVHFANGTIDYLTFYFGHDDVMEHNVGDVIAQGDVIGHTGMAGYVTGDHTHMGCGVGKYQGFTQRPPENAWDLKNRVHAWDAMFVNDTTIIQGYNHNWRTYNGTPTPPTPSGKIKKHKFPFYMYRKRGNKI